MTSPMFNMSSVSAKAAADKIAAELLLQQILEQMSEELVGRRPERSSGPNEGPGCHASGAGNDHI